MRSHEPSYLLHKIPNGILSLTGLKAFKLSTFRTRGKEKKKEINAIRRTVYPAFFVWLVGRLVSFGFFVFFVIFCLLLFCCCCCCCCCCFCIQSEMLHLVQFTLLCAVALLSGSLVSCAIRQTLAERVAAGFIQHNYLLWSSKVPSTLACLRLCSADDSCIGFNFIQLAQTGVCRGHSNFSDQTNSATNFTVEAYIVVSRYHLSSSEDSSEGLLAVFCCFSWSG